LHSDLVSLDKNPDIVKAVGVLADGCVRIVHEVRVMGDVYQQRDCSIGSHA
jgi:hypothetical protein